MPKNRKKITKELVSAYRRTFTRHQYPVDVALDFKNYLVGLSDSDFWELSQVKWMVEQMAIWDQEKKFIARERRERLKNGWITLEEAKEMYGY